MTAAISPSLEAVLVIAGILWLMLALLVAAYGHEKGFPWFPLFLCALLLGWPLVLLAVAIGTGPRRPSGG